MQLQILKLESPDNDIITTFSTGLHTVGRGPLLQCNDNRISREHASIEITNNEAKLTSLHINPCFLKVANSKTITILSKDKTTNLYDGDKFAFLPDLFWFRVKFNNEPPIEVEVKQEQLEIETGKRHLSDSNESSPEKRIKREELDSNYDEIEDVALEEVNFEPYSPQIEIKEEENSNWNERVNEAQLNSNNSPERLVKSEEVEPELTHEIEIKTEETEIPETKVKTDEEENKGSGSNTDSKTKPSDSNGPSTSSRRDRCWYVPNCYRKNAQHKFDFSHPGDADYDSDPSDTRPMCQYGANCYRTNILHRQQFKHPPGKPSASGSSKKKQKNYKSRHQLTVRVILEIRHRGARKTAGAGNSSSSTSFRFDDDDDEEEQDPFFCDGDDSDEYQALTSSSDSDWDDSENVNESGENERLSKVAKK